MITPESIVRFRKMSPVMLLAFINLAANALPSTAAVVINSLNTPYTQDFDSLAATGSSTFIDDITISGWIVNSEKMDTNADAYVANDGSSNGGDVYSYGTDGSTDRALGYLGSGGNDYFNAALILTNQTGGAIDEILVSYTGEQWRSGGNTSDNLNTLQFAWTVGSGIAVPASTSVSGWNLVSSLEFSAPQPNVPSGALDGNNVQNQTTFSNVSIQGLSWGVGQDLALRWIGNNGVGTDAGLAIDNLSITPVPEPSTLILAGIGLVAGGWLARRRRFKARRTAA